MLRDELRGRAQLSRRLIVECVISRLKKAMRPQFGVCGKTCWFLVFPRESQDLADVGSAKGKREKKQQRQRKRHITVDYGEELMTCSSTTFGDNLTCQDV